MKFLILFFSAFMAASSLQASEQTFKENEATGLPGQCYIVFAKNLRRFLAKNQKQLLMITQDPEIQICLQRVHAADKTAYVVITSCAVTKTDFGVHDREMVTANIAITIREDSQNGPSVATFTRNIEWVAFC